jgi:threonine/homoserine/homoserine lactone efflux protein
MELQTYLAFVGASILLCVAPGPDMLYVLSRSVANGRKSGIYAAIGINAGAYVHLCAAIAGLTMILATSVIAFTVVKWIGALYLFYLGMSILLSRSSGIVIQAGSARNCGNREIFWQGFLSDVLNPKVALFYVSIFPQFIAPRTADPTIQMLVLGVTLNMVGILSNILYVYFASSLTRRLRESTRIAYWLNKALGTVFVALGLRLAGEKQI